jgi:hypothetical protein
MHGCRNAARFTLARASKTRQLLLLLLLLDCIVFEMNA